MNTLIHLRLSDNDFYFEKDIIVKNDNELLFDIIINESRKVLKEYKDTLSDDFEIDYVDSLINDYYSIELDHYYGDFSQQLDSYKLPYIKRNGEYKWNVRLQEVTVYEFLDTHNLLDERVINTGVYYAGGGAGDEAFSEILSWIAAGNNVFSGIINFITFLKISKGIYKCFTGEDKRLVNAFDVIEAINKKDYWTVEELKGSIKYINDDIMSLLMKQSGYTREADGYYKNRKSEFSSACSSNKEKYFIAVNQIEEKADCLYGNINEQNDILQNVYLLNKRITSLLFQSNNFKPELIEIINILTDSLINRNSCYLKSGDNFKFVDLEDIFNDNGDLEVNELEIINNKIEDFYCYLTDLEDNLFGLSE